MQDLFSEDEKFREQLRKQARTPLPAKEKKQLWERIESSVSKRKNWLHIPTSYYWIAASVCLVIFVTGLLFKSSPPGKTDYTEVALIDTAEHKKTNSETVRLVTNNGEEITFEGEEPQIIADNYTDKEEPDNSPQMNQLIVPVGKKTYLLLEDGTRLWINSNSKVTYPQRFLSDKREIYADGEIYADVKHDPERPFIVKTQNLQIKVLGTEFNLTAYGEDNKQTVVLVSGKVEVDTGTDLNILRPNSMLVSSDKGVVVKRNIDIYDYVCWKDDVIVLNSISLKDLILKLNRHYGCEIVAAENLNQRKLSGKLDLKNPLEGTIKTLSIILNCKYDISGSKVIINSN